MSKINFLIKFFFTTQVITRLGLVIFSYFSFHENLLMYILPIIAIGLINDSVALSYALPFFTLCVIIARGFSNRLFFTLKFLGYFFSLSFIIYGILSEIFFWDEFHHKFNFIAVDYLIYTNQILGTIYESWPIAKISIGVSLFAILILIVFYDEIFIVKKPASRKFLFWVMILNLLISCVAFKYYRSDYFRLNNNYANEIAKNGYYELFSAFRNNYIDYESFYPVIKESTSLDIVRKNIKQSNQVFLSEGGIARDTKTQHEEKKHNVILILVESLSAEFLTAFGNKNNLTPNLDKLSSESLFFTNFYATGTRTVRGIEAVSLSIPPTPGSSVVRRQGNENLPSLSSILNGKGYNSAFIYGGYSYFDNMKYFFTHNGYQVIDRADFANDEKIFGNIWGLSDEDLFNKSIKIANQKSAENKPFFLFLLTTSNHRPYSFPEGRIDMPSGTRDAAVKYTDYAIHKFIEDSKSQPWFDNTIFVIVADHCATAAGRVDLPRDNYRIPLFIYAPKIIEPKKIDILSGQIDLAPTLLSLMDINYTSEFFGQNIFDIDFKPKAFISTYQLLGFFKDNNDLVILEPNKKPSFMNENIMEAIGFYQNSSQMFKLRHKK